MTTTTILNKSACVTRQGLELKAYLPAVSSLAGGQEEIAGGQCCLGVFRSLRTCPALWVIGGFLLLTHVATKSPSHRQLPASQPARLEDVSGRHLPPGTCFGRAFHVGKVHCSLQTALPAAGKLALGSLSCKAWGAGIACPHLPLNLHQF